MTTETQTASPTPTTHPLLFSGTPERMAMVNAQIATLVRGDRERAARVAAYNARFARSTSCHHCGAGREPDETGVYRFAHGSACAVAEPWGEFARMAQHAWGSDPAGVRRACAALHPHLAAVGSSEDEAINLGCAGRLGRLQDRVAAYLRTQAR